MDIVDVRDVEASLARFGSRYLERVFTSAEVAASRDGSSASRLAACFAAKEATLKAIEAPSEGIGWRSIEVGISGGQKASVTLHGSAAAAAERGGITVLDVSVARTDAYATAIVLAVESADRCPVVEGNPK